MKEKEDLSHLENLTYEEALWLVFNPMPKNWKEKHEDEEEANNDHGI